MELANVSALQLPAALHKFIADTVPEVFKVPVGVNSAPKEQVIVQKLTNPLQWMLLGGDPNVVMATLGNQGTPSNFCGKVFKSGEPAYFCKDCQTDPTCCLCMECFEHSEHKTHKYRLFASGGGGCCDCGDPEAWKSGVYCELHEPMSQNSEEVDPVGSLPPELACRIQIFFKTLLWYCMDVLSSTDKVTLPVSVNLGQSAASLLNDSFLTFLYNDEDHSYDEVIYTLTHKITLTHTEAVALATFVDRKGRAVVKQGTSQVCLQVAGSINSEVGTSPLKVEVYHTTVSSHQECAIICLSLLKELAEKAPAFRRIMSQTLVDSSYRGESQTLLDKFFLNDSLLWITARIAWHRLVMSSIFMDTNLKKQLAISLTTNYCQLQKNFVNDSHHHDVCASNMTVQIFTAPSLSRMLVLEYGLLSVILRTLQDLMVPCKDATTGRLKLRPGNYKHSRIFYIVYDLRYVLRAKPEQWTPALRVQVLQAYNSLLELLSWLQNTDPVRRQRQHQHHVEREEPWEQCFNFSILMQPSILLFLEWCISDAEVLQGALSATLAKHKLTVQATDSPIQYKLHNCEESIVGKNSMELIMFDVLKEAVSIHQPLPRMIAILLAGASQHGLTFTQLLNISSGDHRLPLFLMEFSSRSLVMAVQVMAGMWKRNGYSVVNQIINYQYHHSREIMYDKDILMLQSMASILDPNVFMYALIYKFRLEKWLSSPDSDPSRRGEPTDDALRFFISEAEEFLFLLIVIFTERYACGVGEGMTKHSILQREVIHRLFISPLSHSEIVKHLKLNDNEGDVDVILNQVATRRQHGSTGKFVYVLKPEYEDQCCPFFHHYTRPDHSKVEEIRRKKMKAEINSTALPPRPIPPLKPPPFTPAYSGVTRLAQCPVLHRMMHCVLKQAATHDSKFWSNKLLHETLYLCGVILDSEDSSDPNSLCNAAIGAVGNHPFLPHLEVLLTNQRAEEHLSLLIWVVQFLRAAKPQQIVVEDIEVDGANSQEEMDGAESTEITDAEREAQEKKDKVMQKRQKLMSQIQSMQKNFLDQHKEELDKIGIDDQDTDYDPATAYHHECAVGVDALLHHIPHRTHTACILCTEETKDFASQRKPYVQAVQVQRSAVLSRGARGVDKEEGKLCDHSAVDLLSSRADLPHGVHTGGCAHHMHAECWKSFLDNKRAENARHHFFPLPGQSVEWDIGEFLCPLCQTYGNTVLPLVPQVGQLSVKLNLALPCQRVGVSEWKELLTLAVELGSGDAMDTGSSVDPTFLDRLETLFPTVYKKPVSPGQLVLSSDDKLMVDMQEVFSQAAFMCGYGGNPDASDDRVCVAVWNNCSYVISSLEYNARCQSKFLLDVDTLTSRQLNIVKALVRLGSEPAIRPEVAVQVKYLQGLINCFLIEGPSFPELPSVMDLNCFQTFVNLHFAISSLFISLSSPYGRAAPLKGDPIILQLIGITDEHLIKLVTAALIIQFLLSYSPATDELPSDESSSQEFQLTDGVQFQDLWVKCRRISNLPHDCPPNPNEIAIQLREHMYPFLQCVALFLNALTGIDFIYSSATAATRFEDLCKYVGLPCDLYDLFNESSVTKLSDPSASQTISLLTKNWCANSSISKLVGSCPVVPALQEVKLLFTLPRHYSDLVKKAAAFQCSKRLVDETHGDDGQAAMLCLVCGAMLCTNSYCCQMEVAKEEGEKGTRIGGFTQHVQRCGAGIGMALWILESYVVLLDASDIRNVKGCTVPPPYLDDYGETDPGLRRGNPLYLNTDIYDELKSVWFQHRIPERIRKEMERNSGLMRIRWDHM